MFSLVQKPQIHIQLQDSGFVRQSTELVQRSHRQWSLGRLVLVRVLSELLLALSQPHNLGEVSLKQEPGG